MLKQLLVVIAVCSSLTAPAWAQGPASTALGTGRRVALGDWPEARGANRDGKSAETGLPSSWDLKGTNLLWRVPFGGRSAPIVMGNRVYVQNPSGRGPSLQERVMALDADTGKVLWEYKFNIFQSDVPAPSRGMGLACRRSGDRQRLRARRRRDARRAVAPTASRSGSDRSAKSSPHSRRTAAGRCRRLSTAISSSSARPCRTGARRRRARIASSRSTSARAKSCMCRTRVAARTTRRTPLRYIATINGTRLLIVGLGDGGIHAIKPQTGEKVWSFVAAKRAINTGVVVSGNTVHHLARRREPDRQRDGDDRRDRRIADR